MSRPLLIIGRSVRAAAASARRAGYEPICIRPQTNRPAGDLIIRTCPADDWPTGALKLVDDHPDVPVLIALDMENHPGVLDALAFNHKFLGPGPQAIRAARDPVAFASLPTHPGLKFCATRTASSILHRSIRLVFGVFSRRKYLVKPRDGYGGRGIEWWHTGKLVGRNYYLQEYVRGTPHAAVFTADGWSARLLGVSEQLVGEFTFGAAPFAYCGSIGPVRMSEQARAALSHFAVQLTQRCDMRGVFGIDFIMDMRGNVRPVEVNPRYVESIEVLERAGDLVALSGYASQSQSRETRTATGVHGKAVVFAKMRCRAGDLQANVEPRYLADSPQPGTRIAASQAICTIFAQAANRDQCERELQQRARQIYESCQVDD